MKTPIRFAAALALAATFAIASPAARAQETLKRLGYSEAPARTAYGFDVWDADYLKLLARGDLAAHEAVLARPDEGDEDYDFLQALNDNRAATGERPLFPPELKGITW